MGSNDENIVEVWHDKQPTWGRKTREFSKESFEKVASVPTNEYGNVVTMNRGMGPNYMNAGNMALASHYAYR